MTYAAVIGLASEVAIAVLKYRRYDRFDPARAPRGMGFESMRDRVEALGGALEVVSARGSGTTVACHVPAGTGEVVPS